MCTMPWQLDIKFERILASYDYVATLELIQGDKPISTLYLYNSLNHSLLPPSTPLISHIIRPSNNALSRNPGHSRVLPVDGERGRRAGRVVVRRTRGREADDVVLQRGRQVRIDGDAVVESAGVAVEEGIRSVLGVVAGRNGEDVVVRLVAEREGKVARRAAEVDVADELHAAEEVVLVVGRRVQRVEDVCQVRDLGEAGRESLDQVFLAGDGGGHEGGGLERVVCRHDVDT